MSWERRGSRRYYYRARRDGNRVVKEYIGPEGSPEATNAANEDAETRTTWATLREAKQEQRQAFEVTQAQVIAMSQMASDMISGALLVSG